jgi:hypothetical protein
MGRACSTHEGEQACTDVLAGKASRWDDNIKMDFRETGWGGMDWIDLAKDWWRALVNTVMNFRVP